MTKKEKLAMEQQGQAIKEINELLDKDKIQNITGNDLHRYVGSLVKKTRGISDVERVMPSYMLEDNQVGLEDMYSHREHTIVDLIIILMRMTRT